MQNPLIILVVLSTIIMIAIMTHGCEKCRRENFGSSTGGERIQLLSRDAQDSFEMAGIDKYLDPMLYNRYPIDEYPIDNYSINYHLY